MYRVYENPKSHSFYPKTKSSSIHTFSVDFFISVLWYAPTRDWRIIGILKELCKYNPKTPPNTISKEKQKTHSKTF